MSRRALSQNEKVLWHDLDGVIKYALRVGVTYDQVIETLTNKAQWVARRRDAGTPPEKY